MTVKPETTIAELQARFPNGFAIGPGTPDNPGRLSRILKASSYVQAVIREFPFATGNQGYMVVDLDEA